jgi:hypothetical protein
VLIIILATAGGVYYEITRGGSTQTGSVSTISINLADGGGCAAIGGNWTNGTSYAPSRCIVRVTEGNLKISADEVVVVPLKTEFYLYGNITNYGTLIVHSCCSVGLSGVNSFVIWGPNFTNYGKVSTDGEFGIFEAATFYNYGTLDVEVGLSSGGKIVNEAGGNFTNHGTIDIHPPGGLMNAGTLFNYGSSSLALTSTGPNGPGKTPLDNSGTVVNWGSISAYSVVDNSGIIEDGCGGAFVTESGSSFSGNAVQNVCVSSTSTG